MAWNPAAPVAAAFARFGSDVTVDPEWTPGRVIRAIVDLSTGGETIRGREIVADGGDIRVRAEDVPALPAGTVIDVAAPGGPVRRVVQGEPRWEDPNRLVAILSTGEPR